MDIRKPWLLLAILLFVTFAIRLWLAIDKPIWGDATNYAWVSEYISSQHEVPTHHFGIVGNVEDGEVTCFMPLAYPYLFFVLGAIMNFIDPALGIKILSPILGTLTVLVVYFFAKTVSKNAWIAFFASLIVAFDSVHMVWDVGPWIDPAVSFFMVMMVWMLAEYFGRHKARYLYLSGFFVGAAISTKQTAYIILLAFLLFLFILTISNILRKTSRGITFKELFISIAMVLLASFPFLAFQIQTNGTVDMYPQFKFLDWIFMPKWTLDEPSYSYIFENVSQQRSIAFSFLAHGESLARYPIWCLSSYQGLYWFFIFAGFYFVFKWNKKIFLFLILLFSIFIFFLVITKGAPRYFMTFTDLLSFIFVMGIYNLLRGNAFRRLFSKNLYRAISMIIILMLLLPLSLNSFNGIKESRVSESLVWSGYRPTFMDDLIDASKYLKDHSEQDDIILTGRVYDVAYYSERRILWINEFGGIKITEMWLEEATPATIEQILKEYNIKYILLFKEEQLKSSYTEHVPQTFLANLSECVEAQTLEIVYEKGDAVIYKSIQPF